MQMTTNQQQQQYRIRINGYIKVPQVRVILEDGGSPGIMNTRDALKMAQDQGLDLIEINPKSVPPVCKIADYGKYKYDEKKKQSETKKNQKTQELKELTFRPNTDENDLNHKLSQAREFVEEGHKVKFTVRFRGREISHADIGKDKLRYILEQLGDLIQSNPQISLEGKFMSVIVFPSKKQ